MKKQSFNLNVDPKKRILEFNLNDTVVYMGGKNTEVGRITAIYPRIAYIDVEFSFGNVRVSPEEILKVNSAGVVIPPSTVSAPGHPTVLNSVYDTQTLVHQLMGQENFEDVESILKKIKKMSSIQDKNKAIEFASIKFIAKNPLTAHLKTAYMIRDLFRKKDADNVLKLASHFKSYKRAAWKKQSASIHVLALSGDGLLNNLKLATILKQDGTYFWKMGSGKNMIQGVCSSLQKSQADIDSILDFTIYKKG